MPWWKSGGATPANPGVFLQSYANQRVAALNMSMGSVTTGMSRAYHAMISKECVLH